MQFFRPIIILLFSLIFTHSTFATLLAPETDSLVNEIEIWPGVGPGSDTLTIEENILVRSLSGTCTRNWAIEMTTVPTITPVIPDEPNGAAVILCPGGAYMRTVYDVEGLDIGNWLNSIGITAFVLKYRLPNSPHIDKKNVPLQDAQRALRYVRANAEKWDLDTAKIGIFGASAGGHAASTLAHAFDWQVYEAKDSIDSIRARPDFALLLYPVISMEDGVTHSTSKNLLIGASASQALVDSFSAEKNVTATFPPTFMTRPATDNAVSAENCNRLYAALQDSGIVSELKIFKNGGHGTGICKTVGTDFENWPDHCTNWLYSIGMTEDSVEIADPPVDPPVDPPTGTNLLNEERNEIHLKVFPNPVTDDALISYSVVDQGKVSISLFDITGKQAYILIDEYLVPGTYTYPLASISSELKGMYILRFQNEKRLVEEKVFF